MNYLLLTEEEKLQRASLGYKEILKTLPEQVAIPTELLNWYRQIAKEIYNSSLDNGVYLSDLFRIARTKAIDQRYSNYQIQQTEERVLLELRNNPKKIAARYERISKN